MISGVEPDRFTEKGEEEQVADSAATLFSPHSVKVSIVIPALNEEENLPYVMPRIPSGIHEVILVDGHSTDGTVATACQLCPEIRIIMQEGQGKGAAIRSGFAAATGDIVIILDADGSTDPAEIPVFVGALLAGADFVKGSRFLQGGGTADMTPIRWFGNRFFVLLANLLFRTHFTDITYGYNAIWRAHALFLALEIDGWANEIISNIRAARSGLCVVEVASFEYERIAGEAKLVTFSAGWVILKAIMRERFRQPGKQAKSWLVRGTIKKLSDMVGEIASHSRPTGAIRETK